ncbi:glycerophosphodiester phosphodiesterase family protein [Micromonospora sp. NPDC048909]|uniref:glycerophosphodiester phosphodiesterase family protein n=1 Tax=Micromonospora sp. NPDC048909 TaxID=3155643 RepID=UPI0033F13BD9
MLHIAHQSGGSGAPSNAMYAYQRAVAVGADMLALDAHLSHDVLVAIHDASVDRDGTALVR